MGLLNASMFSTPQQMPQQQGNGMMNAFSGNPQFQQQLQAMLSQQSPGFQGPQMTMPQTPVSTAPVGNTNPGMGGYRGMRSSLGLNGLSMLGVPVR